MFAMALAVWAAASPGCSDCARVEILGHLAAQEHHGAPGDHRLAEIVVELLLRIGVPGVEGPNAACAPSLFGSLPVHAPDAIGEAARLLRELQRAVPVEGAIDGADCANGGDWANSWNVSRWPA